jgi:hypothetical protein
MSAPHLGHLSVLIPGAIIADCPPFVTLSLDPKPGMGLLTSRSP